MDWEKKLRAYLDANRDRYRFFSIDFIVIEAKTLALGPGSPVSTEAVRRVVTQWSQSNNVLRLPGGPGGNPALPSKPMAPSRASELLDNVKRVVSRVAEGVTLTRGSGSLNIKVTGATAALTTAAGSAGLTISWGGTLGLKAESGPFHFAGELSKDKWEIALTFPDDDAVPNLAELPRIFSEGEQAMRKVAVATAGFSNISDAAQVGARIKPHVAALEEAVSAASGIPLPDKKSGKSFGFKLGSPDPLLGEQGIPRGVQATLTFTYWF
jgi:hypothetical protein